MTKMEQSGCKIEICSGEPQRNLNGLLMKVTQSVAQANSIEDVVSGKGISALQAFRDQLVELLLGKLKKTSARVEGKSLGGDEEAVPTQSIYRYEEFLWYKAHYDPLAKAKKLKKPQQWNSREVSSVQSFLQEGINFYLGVLEDLASTGCPEDGPIRHIVARCFVCLGDLARYFCMDLPSGHSSALRYSVPGLYYLQALELAPKNGLTHSNLAAVLCSVERKTCSAMLHYLAALLCHHQHARVLMRPALEGSLRHYEALLDDRSLLVLSSGTTARASFQHTLLTVVRAFLHFTHDPHQLQIVCRNFLLHFDKLLKEVCGGHGLLPAGYTECDAMVVQTSVLLGATYYLLEDAGAKTCSVLLASVLLSLVAFLKQACSSALISCCSPAAFAAIVRPPLMSSSASTSCSEQSLERGAAASPNSTASVGRHKSARRAPRRRRRMRRQPPSGDESSCDEDGAESDWSGTTCSVDFSDALCSSSDDDFSDQGDDSGPDAIIESNSECESVPGTSSHTIQKAADHGISLPGNPKDSPQSLSALQHLLLLAKLDNAGEGALRPLNANDVHRVCSRASQEMKTAVVQGSAPGLLLSATLVCSWLQSASSAKGDIVWCIDPDRGQPVDKPGLSNGAKCDSGLANAGKTEPQNNKCGADARGCSQSDKTVHTLNREASDRDASHVTSGRTGHSSDAQAGRVGGQASSDNEGVGIMWEALAAFCNMVSVDLKLLCSEEHSKDLPNLIQFLKSVSAAKAFQVDAWSELENFSLPEDDLLRQILPDVVAEHVHKEKPRVLVGYLSDSLQRLGVQQQKDHVLPTLEANSPCNKKETTSQLLPRSCLNETEMTLIRTMRLRKTVFQLSQFAGCPLEYDARTRAFYLVSDDATSPVPYDDDQLGNNHNEDEDPEGFYYVKGSAINEINRNKHCERGHYPPHAKPDRRSRPKPRYQDGLTPGRKYRTRRRRHRDKYTNYDDARKSPIVKDYEQRRSHNRDASNPGLPVVGGKVSTSGKSYRQERAGRRTPDELTADNLKTQHLIKRERASYSVSSDDRSYELTKTLADVGGGNSSNRNSPLLSSDDRNTSVGSRLGHFSRDGSLVDPRTPSPSSDELKNGVVSSHLDDFKGQPTPPRLSGASEEEKTRKRQADQRLLTERWLRHELSKSSLSKCSPTPPTGNFTYIVPDALALSHYRPTLTALLKLENSVVVPLQVLSHLDDLKRRMGAARDASRWLEHQVRRTLPGGRLRMQGTAEHRRVPGVNYPGRQHKMPWRWFQILECCHYLARLDHAPDSSKSRAVGSLYSDRMEASTSRPGTPKPSNTNEEDDKSGLQDKKPVIMLLTGETRETISKLPFSLNSLTASVGAEMHFAGEMQKTLPPPPPRRGRT